MIAAQNHTWTCTSGIWQQIHREKLENQISRFKVKPQYPMNDPMAVPRLLYQLLIVAITTLLVLVGGLCWVAWLNGKRWLVAMDDYKMELLREDPSNPRS